MSGWLRSVFEGRPHWMNALMVFSGSMAFVYLPWDFFVKPVAIDEEVWFGIMFRGWAAKLLEPLHWAVYAAGFYGFLRMRPWMWPWASVYAAQVAFGMLVWSVRESGGAWGWISGLVSFAALTAIAAALWRARALFDAPRPSLRQRYGDWALITGASAGIGAEFARALAREGVSCVLSARRESRLRELTAELEKQNQVSTRIAVADLADPVQVEELADEVSDLDLAILVNNAGFGAAGRFEKIETERLRDMVEVNCVAPVVLTRRLLPGLRARGRGAVIFTGSVASRQPLPLLGVYAATKAFDLLFGEALWVEMRGSGVDVLVLEPGTTDTEFQEVAGQLGHGGETAAQVVRVALEALGRQPSVISGWMNWLRANAAARLLPRRLVAQVANDYVAEYTPPELH